MIDFNVEGVLLKITEEWNEQGRLKIPTRAKSSFFGAWPGIARC
jgi:hypothetical protein